MGFVIQKPLSVRSRLLRRIFYRAWKSFEVWRAQKLILDVRYEAVGEQEIALPTIILSTYEKIEDFWVLAYLFRDRELVFLAPDPVPSGKTVRRLEKFNLVLRIDARPVKIAFLRQLIAALKLYNRSVVISPEAGAAYIKNFSFNPGNFSRIAVKANAPIQPVVIQWEGNLRQKCRVFVGKRMFISPRHPEFKDIFFRRKDPRKFSKLSQEEFKEIGERIMIKFNLLKHRCHGSNLS